ncbi:uncharacterized protein LOC129172710 isoform X2 [Dunckerocampus dactyliophorus]|uniref:uncharacterized protein LOC129172710 isoform X2 n=1 Tax=Dunckerocampus dactyliophorus TaxID=161453 RepID=UPI0024058F33|nr:uncharacterized protein LOC129172710 isoform X2 [Dunckerocampus dactyliophorus]
MRMIPLLVQLAICFAIGSTLKCCSVNIDKDQVEAWSFAASCTNPQSCGSADKCFITKNVANGEVSYTVGCKTGAQIADCAKVETHCCDDADGCNWIHPGKEKDACTKQVDEVKGACKDTPNTIKDCMDKVAAARKCISDNTLKCCSVNINKDDVEGWSFAANCTNKVDCDKVNNDVSYTVGCKTKAQIAEDCAKVETHCCDDADGCNWIHPGEGKKCESQVNAVKTACKDTTNTNIKDCMDKVTAARKCTSGVGGLHGGLGLPLVLAISVIVLVVLG